MVLLVLRSEHNLRNLRNSRLRWTVHLIFMSKEDVRINVFEVLTFSARSVRAYLLNLLFPISDIRLPISDLSPSPSAPYPL